MANIFVEGNLNMDLAIQVPTIPEFDKTVLGENFAVYPAGESKSSPSKDQNLIGNIPVGFDIHQHFKNLTKSSRAITLTGEFTPYANIILLSAVVF